MAKKRRKQEALKAEKEWKPPKFDKIGFMRTEVNVAKGTLLGALLALPMALVAVFTYPVGGTTGSFLVGLSGTAFLWVLLPRTNIDTSEYKPMHWLSVFSTYFLLFLALWVLLFNPPFADYAAPAITDVQVSWDGGQTWENVTVSGGGNRVGVPANTSSTSIIVRARVSDNSALDAGSVNITTGSRTLPMSMQNDSYIFQSPEFTGIGNFDRFTIRAADQGGRMAEYVFDIEP